MLSVFQVGPPTRVNVRLHGKSWPGTQGYPILSTEWPCHPGYPPTQGKLLFIMETLASIYEETYE